MESLAGWSLHETWRAAAPSVDWRPSIPVCAYACVDGERRAEECPPRLRGWRGHLAGGALRLVVALDVRKMVVDEAQLVVVSELACSYEWRLRPAR